MEEKTFLSRAIVEKSAALSNTQQQENVVRVTELAAYVCDFTQPRTLISGLSATDSVHSSTPHSSQSDDLIIRDE